MRIADKIHIFSPFLIKSISFSAFDQNGWYFYWRLGICWEMCGKNFLENGAQIAEMWSAKVRWESATLSFSSFDQNDWNFYRWLGTCWAMYGKNLTKYCSQTAEIWPIEVWRGCVTFIAVTLYVYTYIDQNGWNFYQRLDVCWGLCGKNFTRNCSQTREMDTSNFGENE